MQAIGLTHYLAINDDNALFDFETEKPVASGHDILVNVKAVSVNPVDTKVRAPKEKIEAEPRILGWDAAGIVESVGDAVTLFKAGDEVYYAGDITRRGSNAEYQLVDERIVGRKPSSLDFAATAALPLTSITAYEAFFHRLKLGLNGENKGQTLLIIGGAGGVGSIGIQLAKSAGLTVIATASRAESKQWVLELGADYVINHREPMRPQLEALGMTFIDHIAIFNSIDSHWAAVTDLIRPQGRIVSIVENAEPLEMDNLKTKSGTFVWEFMFTRSMFNTDDIVEQHRLLNYLADQIDAGKLKTTLGTSLRPINAENLRRAHAMLESGNTIGKVIVSNFE